MIQPIFTSQQHEVVIIKYLKIVNEFIQDCSSEEKYKNFLQVLDIILQYHNEYGSGVDKPEDTWANILQKKLNTNP